MYCTRKTLAVTGLANTWNTTIAPYCPSIRNRVYSVLKSLVDEGLIAIVGISENEDPGPYRKLHTITENVKSEFRCQLK